jgi:hypothetical protein
MSKPQKFVGLVYDTPPLDPPPRRPQRIEIVIEHIQRNPPPRSVGRMLFILAAEVVVVVAVLLALATNTHAEEQRPLHFQLDDKVEVETHRQGFTEYSTIRRGTDTTTCRTWKQGWQTFTECQ